MVPSNAPAYAVVSLERALDMVGRYAPEGTGAAVPVCAPTLTSE
jgi:hypothetical protein